ncbi:MAG: hypothetical protein C4530_14050 [Desulfobacteraceae bacterium]|nr:MAG: hypothetical protein C4530_14050 [Desulfobacteraceae bacterium]
MFMTANHEDCIKAVLDSCKNDQTLNDPDFFDALDAMLKEKGSSYLETVPEFSRWRWYTGDNIDDRQPGR